LFTGVVIFAQMFDIGLRQKPRDLVRLYRQPGLFVRSLVSVLVVVSLAAVCLIVFLPVPPEVAIGLVLLAAAPGAPMTTRRSETAKADSGYVSALQLTLAALAVVFMPLVIMAFAPVVGPLVPAIAPGRIAGQIVIVTFVPVALVVLPALVLVPDLRATFLIGWAGVVALIAFAAIALASGHLPGGPNNDQRAGLATATVARNLGLALFVAGSSSTTMVAIPTMLTFALLAVMLALP
jgi:BASS family bile acid:Na+ symporter